MFTEYTKAELKRLIYKMLDELENLYILKSVYECTNTNGIGYYHITEKIKSYEQIHDEIVQAYKAI